MWIPTEIKGARTLQRKCWHFPQNTLLCNTSQREVDAWFSPPSYPPGGSVQSAVSSTRGVQWPPSVPRMLTAKLLRQAGTFFFLLPDERNRGILCKGQLIIIWTPTGHPDWTLNKLCQDICSKLASLAALHKQKSAGVQHVEQLPNRVINLYKQKNLPSKHISSHHTPGYKAELSCKLIRISCLLQPRRKAQATYRGAQKAPRDVHAWEGTMNRTDLFSHCDDNSVLFLLRPQATSWEMVKA